MKQTYSRFSRFSLRTSLTLLLLPFLALILVSCSLFYYSGTKKYSELLQKNIETLVQQTKNSLDGSLHNIYERSLSLTTDYRFYSMNQNLIHGEDPLTPAEYLQLSNGFSDFLLQNQLYLDSIGLYLSDNSIHYYNSVSEANKVLYPDFHFSDYSSFGQSLGWMFTADQYPYPITTGRAPDFCLFQTLGSGDGKVNGFFIIGLNDQVFLEHIRNFKVTPNSCLTILRKDSGLLFSDEEDLGSPTLAALPDTEINEIKEKVSDRSSDNLTAFMTGSNYVVYNPLLLEGTGLLAVVPLDEMFTDYRDFSTLLLILALGAVSIFIALYLFMPKVFSHPVVSLVEQMKKITSADTKLPIKAYGSREIVYIGEEINAMLNRIRALTLSMEKEMKAKQVTQLQFLFAQINPHFLYNTLDCIRELCHARENEKAEEMLDQLAVFYRIGVSKGRSFITLKDELLHSSMYLAILKTRFEDFQFEISLPEELENCLTLRMILQPLIENAVYHGIRPCRLDGTIRLDVKRDGNVIHLTVKDNGCGISEDVLEKIEQSLEAPICDYSDASLGVYGIKNIQDRIQLAYGTDYRLSVETEPDCGTSVTITIPYEEGRDNDKNTICG
ncbi:sensor histidine kinase [Murimonas intestini]|uniref:sensor histidine kinase n=1 Tax=Murimonas intestini TaxID=1337051 RepID=UPI0011DCF0FC|nr:sensor histidine kinase [Murimonas intestini]